MASVEPFLPPCRQLRANLSSGAEPRCSEPLPVIDHQEVIRGAVCVTRNLRKGNWCVPPAKKNIILYVKFIFNLLKADKKLV